jgi:hypothetical protein
MILTLSRLDSANLVKDPIDGVRFASLSSALETVALDPLQDPLEDACCR